MQTYMYSIFADSTAQILFRPDRFFFAAQAIIPNFVIKYVTRNKSDFEFGLWFYPKKYFFFNSYHKNGCGFTKHTISVIKIWD